MLSISSKRLHPVQNCFESEKIFECKENVPKNCILKIAKLDRNDGWAWVRWSGKLFILKKKSFMKVCYVQNC